MTVTIRIPAPLRQFCGNTPETRVDATTVGEAMEELSRRFPQAGYALLAETGTVRGYVNLFVNSDNVRELRLLETPLKDGDIIHILPSIAGG